jgi:hypothetical protein
VEFICYFGGDLRIGGGTLVEDEDVEEDEDIDEDFVGEGPVDENEVVARREGGISF